MITEYHQAGCITRSSAVAAPPPRKGVSYLASLFGSERGGALIEVRCPQRAMLRRFFPAGEIDTAAAYIARWATTTDVYVGVAGCPVCCLLRD